MKKINKILACVDLSKYSERTVGYAFELAEKTGAQVLLLNVINQRDIDTVCRVAYYTEIVSPEKYIRENESDRYETIKNMAEKFHPPAGLKMEIRVKAGIPFEEILNTAENENIDLIIMGTKGRSNFPRTLLGSTAQKVFRHSPVPVLSIRERKKVPGNDL